ncbi:LytR C-terminal domain-containing protein [Actinoplanes sp. NBC_00393]|uniref:LytR C-terminal domain-containing protein n=1 Tax=Actinoplanes sp. NBC_00393 TaxID=2975953 RepID=UPI002E23893E
MSQSVREAILDLQADVEQVRLAPAEAVRRRGQQRRRRRYAFAGTSLALVAGVAGFALTIATPGSVPSATTDAATGGDPHCGTVPVNLEMPDGPETVALRIFNGTTQAGVDEQVTQSLRERSFAQARSAGTAAAVPGPEIAVLRYGPRAVGPAGLLAAYFPGPVAEQFDPAREDSAVDVIVGPGFRRLAASTEVNQALVQAGPATVPEQCLPRTGN